MITSQAITGNGPNDPHPARSAAQRSFSAVAKGDLDEWLKVYTEDAVLQDPVGPSMLGSDGTGHHGRDGIRALWKKAIAPIAKFEFEVKDSSANPGSNTHASVRAIKT